MSDDDVQRAEPDLGSACEKLRLLLEAHEASTSSEAARTQAAVLIAIEQCSFDLKLSSVVGKDAARELRDTGRKAEELCRSLSRLLELRSRKRAELQQLVHAFHFAPDPWEGPENEEAHLLRSVIESGQQVQRERIAEVAKLLTSLESEMVRALLGSPLLKSASKIAEAHEHDGLLANPPERATGYVLKRLVDSVRYTVRATLPVIEVIYNDPTLKPMSDVAFKAMLIARLEVQSPG